MDMSKLLARKGLVITAGVGVVLLIMVVWLFASFNGVQKEMVRKEQALSGQYQVNQNELSTFVSKTRETLGVADRASDQLNTVLTDAVKGRYEGETGANPTGGQFFSAITEAYPDLKDNQQLYAQVQRDVSAGREAYKNEQNQLLDMLRDYETWKNSGFVKSTMTSMVGAPSDNLVARIGTSSSRGQAALDQMYVIVLAGEAKEAYTDGEMEPLDLGPTE